MNVEWKQMGYDDSSIYESAVVASRQEKPDSYLKNLYKEFCRKTTLL